MIDLTPDQIKVLKLIANGHEIKQIAAIMGKGVKSIEYHWALIKKKTGATNHVQAALWAFRNKIARL